MHKLSSKKAFSLIELSIVLLIIGIIIAGVTQGSRLVLKIKLSSARTQTKSAPVSSISGIVGWWETTLEESFGGEEPDENPTGGENGVATWHDISPQASSGNNAVSPSANNNPGYTSGSTSINGLPTLQFDGENHYLNFDGRGIVNVNYSIFVVEQRSSGDGNYQYMVTSSTESDGRNQVLQVGYRYSDVITWGQYGNDYDIEIEPYGIATPRIHSLVFNSTATTPKIYYLNGAAQIASDTDEGTVGSEGLASYESASFGFYGAGEDTYYKGNIGEIIIFNRALKTEERQSIEKYLSKKWNIKIS